MKKKPFSDIISTIYSLNVRKSIPVFFLLLWKTFRLWLEFEEQKNVGCNSEFCCWQQTHFFLRTQRETVCPHVPVLLLSALSMKRPLAAAGHRGAFIWTSVLRRGKNATAARLTILTNTLIKTLTFWIPRSSQGLSKSPTESEKIMASMRLTSPFRTCRLYLASISSGCLALSAADESFFQIEHEKTRHTFLFPRLWRVASISCGCVSLSLSTIRQT